MSPINSVNPNLRMSMRTPLSQQKMNSSMTRTPSPYQMNSSFGHSRTPSPHYQGMNSSFSTIQSSTPNLTCVNPPKPSMKLPTPAKEISSQPSYQPNNDELKQKANSALMRLSQTLAA